MDPNGTYARKKRNDNKITTNHPPKQTNKETANQPNRHNGKKSEVEIKRNNKLIKSSTINLFCCIRRTHKSDFLQS